MIDHPPSGSGRVHVQLSLYASLKPYLPNQDGQNLNVLEIEPGTTVKALLTRLGVPLEKVKIIFINGVLSKGERVLEDADRIGVFPPVAGG